MNGLMRTMEPTTHHLRRVGRLARRRMRIEGAELRDGIHTDGRLTVRITGLGRGSAGAPATFEWSADRPIALVIVRSGAEGDDVSFQVGPLEAGIGPGAPVGDGAGIRYIAFCYDAAAEVVPMALPAAATSRPASAAAATAPHALTPARRVVAAILGDRPAIVSRPLRAGATA
jgi:hypothetical protein